MQTSTKQMENGELEGDLLNVYLGKVRTLDTNAWRSLSAYDDLPNGVGRAAFKAMTALQWVFVKRGAAAQVSPGHRREYAHLWREIAKSDRTFASRVRVGSGLTALSLLKRNEQRARHAYDLAMGQVIPFETLVVTARKS